jgi:hypothetical protein
MAIATSDETRFAMPGLSDEGIDYTVVSGGKLSGDDRGNWLRGIAAEGDNTRTSLRTSQQFGGTRDPRATKL